MQIVTSWMEQAELKLIQRPLNRRLGEIKPELQEQLENLSTQLQDDCR
ncbi:MAG TPA: DUF4351 domain-containing protein [Nostocaceae cyanobacterium]|nr:DUF4351 domain-containing protein [Nostocaceae cyanobacterium]